MSARHTMPVFAAALLFLLGGQRTVWSQGRTGPIGKPTGPSAAQPTPKPAAPSTAVKIRPQGPPPEPKPVATRNDRKNKSIGTTRRSEPQRVVETKPAPPKPSNAVEPPPASRLAPSSGQVDGVVGQATYDGPPRPTTVEAEMRRREKEFTPGRTASSYTVEDLPKLSEFVSRDPFSSPPPAIQ
jgi:hypothetical protein